MKIKVKYFGRFATELNKYSEYMELEEGTTVMQFLDMLKERYKVLEHEDIEVSINGKYAAPEDVINGDEIAVYPPISGG